MKTLLHLGALLLVLASVPAVRADNPKPEPSPMIAAVPLRPVDPLSVNFDFPGGSFDKLVLALGRIDGVSFSLITAIDAPEIGKLELPAFSLRNVAPSTVFQVLSGLLESPGYHLQVIPTPNPNAAVGILQRAPGNLGAGRSRESRFLSFQLAPYLKDQSVEDIVGAIEIAWKLDPAHAADNLRIKYHPGTTLLLVSGPEEAIAVTQTVLNQLKHQPPPEKKSLTETR